MTALPPRPLAPAAPTARAELLPLVAVIELKWLAAGVGQHLRVERMQHDRAYALAMLEAAVASGQPTLQRAAARLRGLLEARCAASADAPRPA